MTTDPGFWPDGAQLAVTISMQVEGQPRSGAAGPVSEPIQPGYPDGLEALTASERRIVELAADGLTNQQIAQTLFVTARTVEGHLTNVFPELDVKARTELPAALAAPTPAVPA